MCQSECNSKNKQSYDYLSCLFSSKSLNAHKENKVIKQAVFKNNKIN